MYYITKNNAKVELASPWQRIAAYLINITIYNLILYIGMHVYNSRFENEYRISESVGRPFELWFLSDKHSTQPIYHLRQLIFADGSYDSFYIFWYILCPIFLFFIWQAVQMSLTGQSIGKKIMKIRVISTSGQSSGFAIIVFNREIIFNIIATISLALFFLPIDQILIALRSTTIINILHAAKLSKFLLLLAKFLFPFICFIMLFNKKNNHRTLQDYLAHTVVVKV